MVSLCCLGMMGNVVKVLERMMLGVGREAEVCGLLGGYLRGAEEALVTDVHPLLNLSLQRHSFAIDVEEFCQERDAIRQKGLVPLALYHSHLDGSTLPSFRDKRLPWITDLPLLILAQNEGKVRFGCYGDVDGRIVPISVVPYRDPEARC